MICDKCGKAPATTHIKQIINGIVTDRALCDSCAAEEGIGQVLGGGLSEMLSKFFGDIAGTAERQNALHCPVCGSSFSDIAKTGKAGCAECYRTFYSDLYPYLKRVHGNVAHAGKIPNSAPLAVRQSEDTPDSLRMEMNRLVSEERFEEAAKVRDKIKELEGKKE